MQPKKYKWIFFEASLLSDLTQEEGESKGVSVGSKFK
jgi:hypothetical protein